MQFFDTAATEYFVNDKDLGTAALWGLEDAAVKGVQGTANTFLGKNPILKGAVNTAIDGGHELLKKDREYGYLEDKFMEDGVISPQEQAQLDKHVVDEQAVVGAFSKAGVKNLLKEGGGALAGDSPGWNVLSDVLGHNATKVSDGTVDGVMNDWRKAEKEGKDFDAWDSLEANAEKSAGDHFEKFAKDPMHWWRNVVKPGAEAYGGKKLEGAAKSQVGEISATKTDRKGNEVANKDYQGPDSRMNKMLAAAEAMDSGSSSKVAAVAAATSDADIDNLPKGQAAKKVEEDGGDDEGTRQMTPDEIAKVKEQSGEEMTPTRKMTPEEIAAVVEQSGQEMTPARKMTPGEVEAVKQQSVDEMTPTRKMTPGEVEAVKQQSGDDMDMVALQSADTQRMDDRGAHNVTEGADFGMTFPGAKQSKMSVEDVESTSDALDAMSSGKAPKVAPDPADVATLLGQPEAVKSDGTIDTTDLKPNSDGPDWSNPKTWAGTEGPEPTKFAPPLHAVSEVSAKAQGGAKISSAEAEMLLARAVYDAREGIAADWQGHGGPEASPLGAATLAGACGIGSGNVKKRLSQFGINPEKIATHQAADVLDIDGSPVNHSFLTVDMPDGKKYYVDPTARQFFPSDDGHENRQIGNRMLDREGGAQVAADILDKGFTPLTDDQGQDNGSADIIGQAWRGKTRDKPFTADDYFDPNNLDKARANLYKQLDGYLPKSEIDDKLTGASAISTDGEAAPSQSLKDGGRRDSPWWETSEDGSYTPYSDFWSPSNPTLDE
ncbi:MAG: hypothetical protein HN348_21525 [Proteobacteria bacterium]|nr:hypothetical protein [Pseudomonadota bacterium]